MKRTVTGVIVSLVVLAGLVLGASSAEGSPRKCPPDPPPGSTVPGGLDVVGECHLRRVTVVGPVQVRRPGGLETELSRITGSTYVAPGGELDSGHKCCLTAKRTFIPSTFVGTVTWDRGRDLDLFNATVKGGVVINAAGRSPGTPLICGSRIVGKLTLANADEDFIVGFSGFCPGNRIGAVLVRNSLSGFVVEDNFILGSVHVADSIMRFEGNRVGGSLRCDEHSFVIGANRNSVRGENSCSR